MIGSIIFFGIFVIILIGSLTQKRKGDEPVKRHKFDEDDMFNDILEHDSYNIDGSINTTLNPYDCK